MARAREFYANDPSMLRGAVVEIYSSIGARVAALPVREGESAVNAGSIPAGVYFVQIVKDGTPAGVGRVAVVR